jgi:hypothetical protein
MAGLALLTLPGFAQRINQEGRTLGAAPVVTSPWNEDISRRPVLPNSDAMITRIVARPRARASSAPHGRFGVLARDHSIRLRYSTVRESAKRASAATRLFAHRS